MSLLLKGLWMRWGPHLIVLAAVVGFVLWLDHSAYQRAVKDRDLRDAKLERKIDEAVGGIEDDLADKLAARVVDQIETEQRIETVDRTVIQPIIERELRNAPGLSDPRNGYGVELRDAINTAIQQSANPAAP